MAIRRSDHLVGTAAEWASRNPRLAGGLLGVESDTSQFKIGDGVTRWADLPYAGTAEGTIDDGFIDGGTP